MYNKSINKSINQSFNQSINLDKVISSSTSTCIHYSDKHSHNPELRGLCIADFLNEYSTLNKVEVV